MPLGKKLENQIDVKTRFRQTYLVGVVGVDEVDVLLIVVLVDVVATELLLVELLPDELLIETVVEVELVGFAVVDTGGSSAASTPTERLLVSSKAERGTDVLGGNGFSHKMTYLS